MLCALHQLPEVAGVTIFPGEAVTTGAPSASRPTLCPPAVGTSSPSDCLTRPVLEVLLTHCECNVCGYSVPLHFEIPSDTHIHLHPFWEHREVKWRKIQFCISAISPLLHWFSKLRLRALGLSKMTRVPPLMPTGGLCSDRDIFFCLWKIVKQGIKKVKTQTASEFLAMSIQQGPFILCAPWRPSRCFMKRCSAFAG